MELWDRVYRIEKLLNISSDKFGADIRTSNNLPTRVRVGAPEVFTPNQLLSRPNPNSDLIEYQRSVDSIPDGGSTFHRRDAEHKARMLKRKDSISNTESLISSMEAAAAELGESASQFVSTIIGSEENNTSNTETEDNKEVESTNTSNKTPRQGYFWGGNIKKSKRNTKKLRRRPLTVN